MHFEKWHGLGNDFIVTEQPMVAALARRLCDRRRGVGADGVLVVRLEADASVRMVVLNADGSRPEMCGNGLRCVAGYFAERGGWNDGMLRVRTEAGDRLCEVRRTASGPIEVGAAMGQVRVGERLRFPPEASGASPVRDFVRVDVGNPHAVTFDPWDEAAVDRLGPALERATPGGINVEFARVSPDGRRIELVVWERGVGRTLACGTGAVATAAAAIALGRARHDEEITIALPGGELVIAVDPTWNARMRGPAERVYEGELPEPSPELAGDADGFF